VRSARSRVAFKLGGRPWWHVIPETGNRWGLLFWIDVEGATIAALPVTGKSGLTAVHLVAQLAAPVTWVESLE
jgi:hypothetical protein